MMQHMDVVGNFLVSELLWGMTVGWWQIPLATFFMWFILRSCVRVHTMTAFIAASFLHLCSFTVYTTLVLGVVLWGLSTEAFDVDIHTAGVLSPMWASICYGMIHSVIHVLFFILLRKRYNLNVILLSFISFVSNLLAAITIYQIS